MGHGMTDEQRNEWEEVQRHRMEKNKEEIKKYNEYLVDYYDDSAQQIMAVQVRDIIRELMMENREIIECLLNCQCEGLVAYLPENDIRSAKL